MSTPRVSGVANGGNQEIPTPLGTAVVWSRGQPAVDHRTGRHLHPGNYFRYHVNHAIEFHLEGLFPQSVMQKMGTAIACFFMDTDDITSSTTFALSIGGNQPLAHDGWSYGMDDRGRTTLQRFLTSSYATPLAFMTNGPAKDRMKSITVAACQARYCDQNEPRNPTIPATMLTSETLKQQAFIAKNSDEKVVSEYAPECRLFPTSRSGVARKEIRAGSFSPKADEHSVE